MRSDSPLSAFRGVLVGLAVALCAALPGSAAAQQQPAAPAPAASSQKPAPKPAPKPAAKPAPNPAPAAPAIAPAEPVAAPPSPPQEDLRFRTTYTTEGQKTETVTYVKGPRERFEFQDMVLLKQHDQKRTIQISKAANTYLVAPDGAPSTPVAGVPNAPAKPGGNVVVATTIVDTGERKAVFGQQARRVKTTIDRQPMAGACDTTKQRFEMDGWYIDAPKAMASQAQPADALPTPGGCSDQIQATANGDPSLLGFPIAYTTTVSGAEGKTVVSSMEVTEFELTTLDAALFEIPQGLHAAMDVRALAKALSDINETTLATADTAAAVAPQPRTPDVVRIGVPELTNKTPQAVDTRALRQRLITDLIDVKVEAMPMVAAPQADLQKRATELGYDFLLLADVTELKASKPGRLGGLVRAASGVAGGGAGASAQQEITESTIAVRLIQPDGRQRLSTTTRGKDGSGFTLQTGLGLAKFAGTMYLTMMVGPQMFARLNGLGAAHLGGMGVLGNPKLFQMQAGGLAGLGRGAGIDHTAGAASFLMQRAMVMNDMGGFVGVPGQGLSYDESLGEAVQNAARAVQKTLQTN